MISDVEDVFLTGIGNSSSGAHFYVHILQIYTRNIWLCNQIANKNQARISFEKC